MSCDLSIFLIEPNLRDVQPLARALSGVSGYAVSLSVEPDPARGLALLSQSDAAVLIVADELPAITGAEFIRAARQAGEARPIIAITRSDCGYLAADLVRAGADGYLAKRDVSPAFLSLVLCRSIVRAEGRNARRAKGRGNAHRRSVLVAH